MKIVTVLGTRPEIIRLSRIIYKLDNLTEHILIHTGQNYDPNLSDIFFSQLGVRSPNFFLNARGAFGEQIATILRESERILVRERPNKFLVLGDTNSALSAIVAKRLGIPVYHMEAGNRCYDDRVPEEVNRRIIDHSSDVLLPYTERSRQNLIREGINGEKIFVTGNPIFEVIQSYDDKIKQSSILESFGLVKGSYFLVTLHRAENVDEPIRLKNFMQALDILWHKYNKTIIFSTHPRTREKLDAIGNNSLPQGIIFAEPFGFFDFVNLEKNAFCVLSDSGTVQEECAILGVPTVTLRDATERPETLECGSNILSGSDIESIALAVEVVLASKNNWVAPREYLVDNVSDTVTKLLCGYRL